MMRLICNTQRFHHHLPEAREAAGLSQKQLGIKAGINEFSASTRMSQYETGKHTDENLANLHSKYGKLGKHAKTELIEMLLKKLRD